MLSCQWVSEKLCRIELELLVFSWEDLLCALPVYYTLPLSHFECFTEILCCILPIPQVLHSDADHKEEALSSLLVKMADTQVDKVSHRANPQCHSEILRSCRLHMTPLIHRRANMPPTRSTFCSLQAFWRSCMDSCILDKDYIRSWFPPTWKTWENSWNFSNLENSWNFMLDLEFLLW